jgi:hypothetical protein
VKNAMPDFIYYSFSGSYSIHFIGCVLNILILDNKREKISHALKNNVHFVSDLQNKVFKHFLMGFKNIMFAEAQKYRQSNSTIIFAGIMTVRCASLGLLYR